MVKTQVLPNGLTLVAEKIPFVRSVCFGIWVKNGSRNESRANNGISHFIEHMLFKGTDKRTAGQIADEIDAVGGQLNAYTSKEYTCYYTRTLDANFDIALDIISDMFFNSKFDEEEIHKERNVIFEEINMYEDSPEELVHDILNAEIWKDNSLGYPILGTAESISTFDNQAFKNYFNRQYIPANTVIAITGSFDEEEVISKIKDRFASFKDPDSKCDGLTKSSFNKALVTKEKEIEQVHLAMGFEGLSIGSEKSQAMAVLNTVIGGGLSSRLFQKIREEEGLVYSVYSYHSSFMDTGLFTIYAGLNRDNVPRVIELTLNEIEKFRCDNISVEQLQRTKEQLKSNYLLSMESTASRMSSIGKSQLLLNTVYGPDEIIGRIDNVCLEDLSELAQLLFDRNKMSLAAVGNVGGIPFKGII